jgi:hypothetical protein
VVRPPDEEPPPFGDFGWKLWQAGEAVDEWREELRTLYVACTRAEDYLVLSAALKPDVRPEGAWMRLLAERFDLRTGLCLVPGLSPEQVPQVRVTDALRPPATAAVSVAPPEQPEAMPVPARPTEQVARPGPRIITLSELQSLLDGVPLGLPAPGQDVEDESDLHDWLPPRQRSDPQPVDVDAHAWIASLIAELPPGAGCHHDVEMLMPLDGVAGHLVVCGFIDLLWHDSAGDRHLAWFQSERLLSGTPEDDWQRHLASMTLAAQAVKSRWGRWPRTVTRHYRWEKLTLQHSGGRLPVHRAMAEIGRALAAMATSKSS